MNKQELLDSVEPSAWMYPSDLEIFSGNEAFAQSYSIKVGCSEEDSVPLYSADTVLNIINRKVVLQAAMQQEIEELKRNDARYKLLRSGCEDESIIEQLEEENPNPSSVDEFEAAIDAVLAKREYKTMQSA